jgi:hypothetical protein
MKYIWLLIPCILACYAGLYNTIEPRVFGIPFFFWFQLLLIPLSSIFILLAYLGERK